MSMSNSVDQEDDASLIFCLDRGEFIVQARIPPQKRKHCGGASS
jgi:hypothetical protein